MLNVIVRTLTLTVKSLNKPENPLIYLYNQVWPQWRQINKSESVGRIQALSIAVKASNSRENALYNCRRAEYAENLPIRSSEMHFSHKHSVSKDLYNRNVYILGNCNAWWSISSI